jgi:hypothetical protein
LAIREFIQVKNLTQTTNNHFRYSTEQSDKGLTDVRANRHQIVCLKRSPMLTANGMEVAETSLQPQIELPLRATYFPLGFPLDLFSNSPAVLAAAEESWKFFQPRFTETRMEIRIAVQGDENDNSTLPPAPIGFLQSNLLLCVADAHNFVVCDFNNSRSSGTITKATANSPLYLRYHFLEAAALGTITSLHAAPVHAACVCPGGVGMLLCGVSGVGKSSLAYAGARSGWTFVSDDASYLLGSEDRVVIGNAHKIRFRDAGVKLFPELEGKPITPRATGKPSIEVPTTELPDLKTSDSATIEYVVFLNRRSQSADGLVPLSRSSVIAWFMESVIAATQSRLAQEAAIDRLLSVPIFELRYRDLDWAVERLEQLAATGR